MEKELPTVQDLIIEAGSFIQKLTTQDQGATLVTLSGELGAGKTTFVQGAAETLGLSDTVTSPTFVLEKVYALPEGNAFNRLVHIDAYRLRSGAELSTLGFSELMHDPKTLIMLEWPERVLEVLPKPSVTIQLNVLKDGGRGIITTYA